MQALAERLLAVAAAVHQELRLDSTDTSMAQWQTIIHGDFKTANLFFSPTAGVNMDLSNLCNYWSPVAHCFVMQMVCCVLH